MTAESRNRPGTWCTQQAHSLLQVNRWQQELVGAWTQVPIDTQTRSLLRYEQQHNPANITDTPGEHGARSRRVVEVTHLVLEARKASFINPWVQIWIPSFSILATFKLCSKIWSSISYVFSFEERLKRKKSKRKNKRQKKRNTLR